LLNAQKSLPEFTSKQDKHLLCLPVNPSKLYLFCLFLEGGKVYLSLQINANKLFGPKLGFPPRQKWQKPAKATHKSGIAAKNKAKHRKQKPSAS
jgi:hypothetical protein